MLPTDGYGYAAIKIGAALEQLVNGVQVVDMANGHGSLPYVGDEQWPVEGTGVVMTVPDWWEDVKAERLVGFTMFESTQMPPERVATINRQADVCLVPSDWCAESFAEQGVRIPIEVAPWGVDTNDYFPLGREREEDHPYTFLWSGTPDLRKGWDLVYGAFIKAFGRSTQARLMLHFRSMPKGVLGFRDANVEVVTGYFDRPQLREMLQAADCFVFPSRGEGWGSPPREAAATGLPVIVTNWGGLAHEIGCWAIPLSVKRLEWAMFGLWQHGDIGHWAEPDKEELAEHMRWCFENQELAAEFGGRAAGWLATHTPWTRTACRVAEVAGV
jgi:hypothetical protein